MFKVTYRPMWPGALFTCLFIQMFVLLVTQVIIIKDYLLTYLLFPFLSLAAEPGRYHYFLGSGGCQHGSWLPCQAGPMVKQIF